MTSDFLGRGKLKTTVPWLKYVKITAQIIPLVTPAVWRLYFSSPPAGQLCSRCHVSPPLRVAGADAQRGGGRGAHFSEPAPLVRRAAVTAWEWKAAPDASLHRHPSRLFVHKLRLFVVEANFCVRVSGFFLTPPPLSTPPVTAPLLRTRILPARESWGASSARGASVRCPITSRAPRSHRHGALRRGEQIAHGRDGRRRRHGTWTELGFWHRHPTTEDIAFKASLYRASACGSPHRDETRTFALY